MLLTLAKMQVALRILHAAICETSWTCREAEAFRAVYLEFGLVVEADVLMRCHAATDDHEVDGDWHVRLTEAPGWRICEEAEGDKEGWDELLWINTELQRIKLTEPLKNRTVQP